MLEQVANLEPPQSDGREESVASKGGWSRRSSEKRLTKFMALRCFTFENQSQIIRGYLSAMKYFHRMLGGWELPTSHCMVAAVGKEIDRAHGKSEIHPKVRKPLTWDLLTTGIQSACELGTKG